MTSALLLVAATGIYTGLFQAVPLVAGATILTWIGLDKVGGFEGLRTSLPPDYFHMIKPASDPVYPWIGTTLGALILGIWYWCTNQVIVQKTLAAKNVQAARLAHSTA